MLAGHLATAIVAKQQAPRGHIAFYLVASQLPDLLWQLFHFVGVEPSPPLNPMAVSLDGGAPPMHLSHDLLPVALWTALVIVFGRLAFQAWRPGLAGGLLMVGHELTDLAGGYPHFVWGPSSAELGTGLYLSAPYLAVGLEALFTVGMLAWVVRTDRGRGARRSFTTWLFRVGVFGSGLAFMLGSADLSMAEALGVEPLPVLDGLAMVVLASVYFLTTAPLVWGETRPVLPAEPSLPGELGQPATQRRGHV